MGKVARILLKALALFIAFNVLYYAAQPLKLLNRQGILLLGQKLRVIIHHPVGFANAAAMHKPVRQG